MQRLLGWALFIGGRCGETVASKSLVYVVFTMEMDVEPRLLHVTTHEFCDTANMFDLTKLCHHRCTGDERCCTR